MKTLSEIDFLRGRIAESQVKGVFEPSAASREAAIIMAYASTTIEGSTLTEREVQRVADKQEVLKPEQHVRMVDNYLRAIGWIRMRAQARHISEKNILDLHRIIGEGAVDEGPVGQYRQVQVYVGDHRPPAPKHLALMMKYFLEWLNGAGQEEHPLVTAALAHLGIADIHPFRDGNGRLARALFSWELYRRGFDTLHIFTIDDLLLARRQFYYRQLQRVNEIGDASDWLEYVIDTTAAGMEKALTRLEKLRASVEGAVPLSKTQARILSILAKEGPCPVKQLTGRLGISRQGLYKALKPILAQERVTAIGTRKSRMYALKSR